MQWLIGTSHCATVNNYKLQARASACMHTSPDVPSNGEAAVVKGALQDFLPLSCKSFHMKGCSSRNILQEKSIPMPSVGAESAAFKDCLVSPRRCSHSFFNDVHCGRYGGHNASLTERRTVYKFGSKRSLTVLALAIH